MGLGSGYTGPGSGYAGMYGAGLYGGYSLYGNGPINAGTTPPFGVPPQGESGNEVPVRGDRPVLGEVGDGQTGPPTSTPTTTTETSDYTTDYLAAWQTQQTLGNVYSEVFAAEINVNQARRNLEQAQNALQQAQNGLQQAQNGLQQAQQNLQQAQQNLQDKKDKLDQDGQKARARINRLERDLGNLVANFEIKNEDDREAMRQAVADLNRRIKEEHDKINQMKQDVRDAQAAVGQAQAPVNAAQQQVDAAQQQVNNAQQQVGQAQGNANNAQTALDQAQQASNQTQQGQTEGQQQGQQQEQDQGQQSGQDQSTGQDQQGPQDGQGQSQGQQQGTPDRTLNPDFKWQGVWPFRYLNAAGVQNQVLTNLLFMPNSERGSLQGNEAFNCVMHHHNFGLGKQTLTNLGVGVMQACCLGGVGKILGLSLTQKAALTAGVYALKSTPEVVNYMNEQLKGTGLEVHIETFATQTFEGAVVTIFNPKTGEYTTTGHVQPTGGTPTMGTGLTGQIPVTRPSSFTVQGTGRMP